MDPMTMIPKDLPPRRPWLRVLLLSLAGLAFALVWLR